MHRNGTFWLVEHTLQWILIDALLPPETQITSCFRAFGKRHPIMAQAILIATYLHLSDRYTPMRVGWADPYTWPSRVMRRVQR